MKFTYILPLLAVVWGCLASPHRDDNGFAYTLDNQFRNEENDGSGGVIGEYGVRTGDGCLRITRYRATNKGGFKVLAVRKEDCDPERMNLRSRPIVKKQPNVPIPVKKIQRTTQRTIQSSPTTERTIQAVETTQRVTTLKPKKAELKKPVTAIKKKAPRRRPNKPKQLKKAFDFNTLKTDDNPARPLDKKEDPVYSFGYSGPGHGHTQSGRDDGTKEGQYYFDSPDGWRRIVTYVATKKGFFPKMSRVRVPGWVAPEPAPRRRAKNRKAKKQEEDKQFNNILGGLEAEGKEISNEPVPSKPNVITPPGSIGRGLGATGVVQPIGGAVEGQGNLRGSIGNQGNEGNNEQNGNNRDRSGVDGGRSGVDGGRFGVDGGQFGVDGGRFGIDGGRSGVYGGRFGVDGGRSGVDGGRSGVDGGRSGVDGGRSGVDGGRSGVDGGRSGVDGGRSGVDEGRSGINGGQSGVNGGQSGVNGGQSGVNGGQSGVNGGQSGVDGGQFGVDGGRSGVDGGRSGVDGGRSGVDGGRSGVDGGRSGVDGGRSGVDGGQSGVDGGRFGVDGGRSRVDGGINGQGGEFSRNNNGGQPGEVGGNVRQDGGFNGQDGRLGGQDRGQSGGNPGQDGGFGEPGGRFGGQGGRGTGGNAGQDGGFGGPDRGRSGVDGNSDGQNGNRFGTNREHNDERSRDGNSGGNSGNTGIGRQNTVDGEELSGKQLVTLPTQTGVGSCPYYFFYNTKVNFHWERCMENGTKVGQYGRLHEDGFSYRTSYYADTTGYHPTSTKIPMTPEQRSIVHDFTEGVFIVPKTEEVRQQTEQRILDWLEDNRNLLNDPLLPQNT